MSFQEYPKYVSRPRAGGGKISKIVASKQEEAAWLALSDDEAQAASSAPPVAPATPAQTAKAADSAENAAFKAENARLTSLVTAIEDEKRQLRDALEDAKKDFLALQAELSEARSQAPELTPTETAPAPPEKVEGQQEGEGEPELPENWRELHHKTLISLAGRFVAGISTKEDAVSTLELVEKRRRGDADRTGE